MNENRRPFPAHTDAKFINKNVAVPSGGIDGDTYFQDEVTTATTQTSPNRFWGKVGGAWVETFQSWWKLFGTILKLNSGIPLIRDAIQVQTQTGTTQGNIGIHTTPSVQTGYDTHESGQALHQKGLVFPAAPYNDAVATSSKIVVAPYSVRTAAFTGEFTQILTQIPLNATTRANYTITIRLQAFGSGNSAVDYRIRFTTNSPYGSGGIEEYGVSVSGGVISNRLSSVYIANVGGFVAIVFQSPHLFSTPVFISILDATVTYQNAGSADALYLTGFTTSILTATPAGAIALATRNDFKDIVVNGTAYSSTGQTTFLPVPSMEKFKELLPEISDETALELASLLPRQLFKYIESGQRAYGWIVEEVQKAFETVRIGSSEAEQTLLDDLLNDTVLMFDERKVFPKDWQPFEPKQADEQGEMTDEEYKEYLDKFQKEQDAALSDFTERLEELPTEKLYTVNPDAIAYIKDRAFHIVLSKF